MGEAKAPEKDPTAIFEAEAARIYAAIRALPRDDLTALRVEADRITSDIERLNGKLEHWNNFTDSVNKAKRKQHEGEDAIEAIAIRGLRELCHASRLRCDLLEHNTDLTPAERATARASTHLLNATVNAAVYYYRFGYPFSESVEPRVLSVDGYIQLLHKTFIVCCAFAELIHSTPIKRYFPLKNVLVLDLFDLIVLEETIANDVLREEEAA